MKQYKFFFLYVIFIFNCGDALDLLGLSQDVLEDIIAINNKENIVIRPLSNQPVTADKIIYRLFKSSDPQNPTIIDASNASSLSTSDCTIFLIHGWHQALNPPQWYESAKNALFARDSQCQIIGVDWNFYANLDYYNSQYDTKQIGDIVAEFIVILINKYSITLDKILLIGHSMGAHICGFIGKKFYELTGLIVPKIVALDPVGPIYQMKLPTERLAPTDARVVHVISTNAGEFGFAGNCGTITFRPNGGSSQPGCPRVIISNISDITSNVGCDHSRSMSYFLEGIKATPKFVARKCESYAIYKATPTLCYNETEEMCSLVTNKIGNFYLDTNDAAPYSKE